MIGQGRDGGTGHSAGPERRDAEARPDVPVNGQFRRDAVRIAA